MACYCVGAVYVFVLDAGGDWSEAQKLIAHDGDADDHFGYALAASNNTLVVGVQHDDDLAGNSGVVDILCFFLCGAFIPTSFILICDIWCGRGGVHLPV